ncbi:uncharacterized protein [Eurosta solidaginis]|uniref:uncharacterized protein isoform X1 n=2 Tax=Eurosta solidaginis TaxID=178769 RepID=UPI003531008B
MIRNIIMCDSSCHLYFLHDTCFCHSTLHSCCSHYKYCRCYCRSYHRSCCCYLWRRKCYLL